MRHEQDGLTEAALQFQQQVLHFFPHLRVQRSKRLVHQQDLGLEYERTRERGALLHAAGKLVRIGERKAGQADQMQHVRDRFHPLRAQYFFAFEAEFHILRHGQPGEQRRRLKHHAAFAAVLCKGAARIAHRACIRAVEPRDDIQ